MHLDGSDFANALVSGIHRVIGDQEVLNRINVFPVADGDTGTNLSLSLGAALDLLQDAGEKHLGTLLASLADTLLDGARGNSGAIVAQFFQGLSDSAEELTRFTAYTFSKAVSEGSEYAHDALSNPKEGTILTVIAAFADALRHEVGQSQEVDFPGVFERTLGPLDDALAATQEQLDVLRKAGVVDAGAKGFVDLVKGMGEYILHGRIAEKPDLSVLELIEPVMTAEGSSDEYAYRYCTECIVTGAEIDRRKLREALAELGDSLVLAGTKRKAKIHIHANDPEAVFEIGREYGDVSAEKADDLQRQQHGTHDTTRRFAVITDSAADIADEDMERLDIHMVPCRLQFGERGYIDKVSISTQEFYTELVTNPTHPTTSQPAPGDFRRQFQFLASHYPDVLSINLAGAVSGTLEAARAAAGRTNAPGNVHVIDSVNASVGQGLLVVFAAECAAAGRDVASTMAAVKRLVPATRTFGLLENLDFAVRGGRIPQWAGRLTRLIMATPIIHTTPGGRVSLSGLFFGKRQRVKRFVRHVARRVDASTPINVAIGYSTNPDDVPAVEAELRRRLPGIQRVAVAELGSALGVHGGPGLLIVSTQPVVSTAADDA